MINFAVKYTSITGIRTSLFQAGLPGKAYNNNEKLISFWQHPNAEFDQELIQTYPLLIDLTEFKTMPKLPGDLTT
jgi:hypothetical protein